MTDHSSSFEIALRTAIDTKTKPVGALGRIETLAARIARIQKTLTPVADTCRLTIFAADHGIAGTGVSHYPQDVTRQMVLNFLSGGAAANVFARSVGADLQIVDCGMMGEPVPDPALVSRRIAPGTENALEGPAMTAEQLEIALSEGAALEATGTHQIACFGEMGIGNTSSASLVGAKLLGLPVETLVGRGTGLDDEGVTRKAALLRQASDRTADRLDVKTALSEYGGFEIAMMAGAMCGAAETGRIVIVDGYIASVAALCAQELAPAAADHFVFAHRSAEAGHNRILDALSAEPLLELDMRLGEGTGALLAVPLVRAAAAMLREMASFESAGVSGPA
jgi:nicotinate-nucleotide--dimethylbenzimidazole phosphoribosyltransferase